MEDVVVSFMLDKGFQEPEDGITEPINLWVKSFRMCPTCGNMWSLCVYRDGKYSITNEFGQVCWENGNIVYPNGEKSRMYTPGNGYITESVTTIEDVRQLLDFIECYKHKQKEG